VRSGEELRSGGFLYKPAVTSFLDLLMLFLAVYALEFLDLLCLFYSIIFSLIVWGSMPLVDQILFPICLCDGVKSGQYIIFFVCLVKDYLRTGDLFMPDSEYWFWSTAYVITGIWIAITRQFIWGNQMFIKSIRLFDVFAC
jgi:hypothetical protein